MRRQTSSIGLLVMAALLLLAPAAGAQSAAVTLTAGTAKAGPDASTGVPITMETSKEVGALHVEVTFDSKVLQATGVTGGNMLPQGSLIDFNVSQPGRAVIGLATLAKLTGSGTLATVQFKVVGEKGATSTIGLEKAAAWEGNENRFDLLVATTSGTFTVSAAGGGTSPLLWILLVAAAVVVALVIWLLLRRRRKTPAGPPPPPVLPPKPAATVTTPPAPGAPSPPAGPLPAPPPTTTAAPSGSTTLTAEAPHFCSHCGAPVAAGMAFCPSCGAHIQS